jgi:tetratricopeptide (TPR) repeat protein
MIRGWVLCAAVACAALPCVAACSSTPPAQSPSEPEVDLAGADEAAESPEFDQGVDAIGKGDFATAHTHFLAVVSDQPNNAKGHFYLGVAEQNLGKNAEASKSYEQAVTLDANLAEAWVNWSALHLDAGEFDQALGIVDRGLARHTNHAGLMYNRALSLAGSGKTTDAVVAYRNALAADPGNAEVKYGYAEALVAAGSTDAALKELDALAQGDNLEVLASTARLLGRLKQFDACVATVTKALAIKALSELYVDRGLCQHGKKDDAAAFEDFQRAVKADDGYAPAHYYSGMHLKMKGKKAEARAALSRAVTIAGDEGVGKAAKRALESL